MPLRDSTARNVKAAVYFALAVSIIAAFAGLCLTGCATSIAFSQGLKVTGPKLLPDVKHYATTDEQKAQATTLETALADPTKVGVTGVEKAWNDVRGWYSQGFETDPVVTSDPDRLALRRKLVENLNSLIAHEKSRPFGAGG